MTEFPNKADEYRLIHRHAIADLTSYAAYDAIDSEQWVSIYQKVLA